MIYSTTSSAAVLLPAPRKAPSSSPVLLPHQCQRSPAAEAACLPFGLWGGRGLGGCRARSCWPQMRKGRRSTRHQDLQAYSLELAELDSNSLQGPQGGESETNAPPKAVHFDLDFSQAGAGLRCAATGVALGHPRQLVVARCGLKPCTKKLWPVCALADGVWRLAVRVCLDLNFPFLPARGTVVLSLLSLSQRQ